MKKYLFKGILFASPVIIYLLFIVVVDPYNFINIFHVISDQDKFIVIQRTDESSPRGNIFWKTIQYKRNPLPRVIIGDSQGKDIRTDLIEEITGEKYYNLCFPGASYRTIFEMFWFAAAQTKLEKVCFQVAFMNFNGKRDYNLSYLAKNYFKLPYKYFTSKEIFFDSFINIAWVTTRNPWLVSRSYEFLPPDQMEELATSRLDLFFKEYSYPESYVDELRKIRDYCMENNIDIRFVILPVYEGVDHYLAEIGRDDEKRRFKADIISLGNTMDLDQLMDIKTNRANFFDYFHPKQPIMDSLTRVVWRKG